MESADEIKFTFHLSNRQFFADKALQDSFLKWSLKNRLRATSFTFDQEFKPYHKDKFLASLLNDPLVLANLYVHQKDQPATLGSRTKATKVRASELRCAQTSMEFFDRFLTRNIVRETGHIHKCFEEQVGDVLVGDELRKMLIMEDSDNYDLYGPDERNEFLFRIFKHLVIGGLLTQYEDMIEPYLEATKKVYKDLVSVCREPDSKLIRVLSLVYDLSVYDEDGSVVFPCDDTNSPNSFAYAIVDPLKKCVTVFYHHFGVGELPTHA